jgi:uncharacterized protein YndB with AHSA1/START domain
MSGPGASSRKDLILTRTLQAPRELVFEVFTRAEHLKKWWAPGPFTVPSCEVDLRPGGSWRYVFRSPEGLEHRCEAQYLEVDKPRKLVMTQSVPGQDGRPLFKIQQTVLFEAKGKETEVRMEVQILEAHPGSEPYLDGMEAGTQMTFDNLVGYVKLLPWFPDREIVSTRVMNAPRELVWRAWTEPEHLAKWWGPLGFTNSFQEFNLKPGGTWRFVMHGPDGKDYQNECVFVEITRPERIILDHVSTPKFRITAAFEEIAGKTRVVFRQLFETSGVYDAVKGFAVPGNEQNFDRFEAELVKMI